VDQVHCTASAANRSMQVCISCALWNIVNLTFLSSPLSLSIFFPMPSVPLSLRLILPITHSLSLSPCPVSLPLSLPPYLSLYLSLSLLTGKAQPENPVKMVRSRFSALVYKVTKSSINLYNVMCSNKHANMKFIDHTY
jgi:hypothetical protein